MQVVVPAFRWLGDDDLDVDGNMSLNNAAAMDPSRDIITVGADGRIYTGSGTV